MKSLICSGFIAASLVLTGNAAMAANTHVHRTAEAHVARHVVHSRAAVHYAARGRYYYYPRGNLGFDIGQFIQSMLSGGPVRYSQLVRDLGRSRAHRDTGTYDFSSSYSPSYDNPPIDESSAAYQAAQNAMDQANEASMLNSMQAAQQQNDAANAQFNADMNAAIQTEINANQ